MIPKQMESFLRLQLPERTWKNRLVQEGGKCYMDFGPLDTDRLARLGIEVDSLGPKLVSCIWDDESPLEVGGYLVVDNLAMGRPSMGGIRMLPDLTPSAVHNLARGMTLKNAAANLPYGGGKSGIVADPNLPTDEHNEIVRRFAQLLFRFRDIYLPGPDVGTNDADMKIVAVENGLDNALSKPVDMGGNRIDQLGAAGGGLVIALEALLNELPRMQSLPQFASLTIPSPDNITVILQGFGAVGAHAARILHNRIPGARVVGISDASGYLFDSEGLPVETLFKLWQEQGNVTRPYYQTRLSKAGNKSKTKFSTDPDDVLRESAFCMIPAAPIANYLDTDITTNPSMVTDRMGSWGMIIEGANTYSPDMNRRAARARMEREVYRRRGIMIATDYMVNSGGVIFAAQEHLIKTPNHLRIPDEMLGNYSAVDEWLKGHSAELEELAAKRLEAAEISRDEVIRGNMRELVDSLISDADMLPHEAAERISIQRITSREKVRTAANIMETIVTIQTTGLVQEAARLLVETGCPLLVVVTPQEELAGVITTWDITKAASRGPIENATLEQVMTRSVITAKPDDSILDVVRKLEYYEISAMPVVENNRVKGIISTDILSRRSLFRLLQNQYD
jgi:glutamate dehydrogenase/leucine dehydrogenase/predicted transcriptional regulator